VVGCQARLLGVGDLVGPQRGHELAGNADGIDPARDPAVCERVTGEMTDRGLPRRAQHGGRVKQSAGIQHIPRPAIDPVPPLAVFVVIPLTLVDEPAEP
jgi:hypothetical protein